MALGAIVVGRPAACKGKVDKETIVTIPFAFYQAQNGINPLPVGRL
ncbi:hypothetical protein [Sporomusa sphaeroides]